MNAVITGFLENFENAIQTSKLLPRINFIAELYHSKRKIKFEDGKIPTKKSESKGCPQSKVLKGLFTNKISIVQISYFEW